MYILIVNRAGVVRIYFEGYGHNMCIYYTV